MKWISVDEAMPEAGPDVLIFQETGYKKNTVIVCGKYIKKFTVQQLFDFDGWLDHNEEDDEYYLPEGWYENQFNWDEHASIHISQKVTHWMKLPEPPTDG